MRKQCLLYEALTETFYGAADCWVIITKLSILQNMLTLYWYYEGVIVTEHELSIG